MKEERLEQERTAQRKKESEAKRKAEVGCLMSLSMTTFPGMASSCVLLWREAHVLLTFGPKSGYLVFAHRAGLPHALLSFHWTTAS